MKKLVILGGGYGGFQILQDLLNKQLPRDVQITVIDRNPYHCLKTEFYALAAGTVSDRQVRMNFPKHDQVDYVWGEVVKIDSDKDEIVMKDSAETVPYDYLIIGLGCEDNYHNVEGAEQFSDSVQTISKARRAALAVNELKSYQHVAVIGAGLSGVEVASEIRESRPDLNISLFDRGNAVLSPFAPKVQQYVEKWFKENDVNIIHHANVEYLEQGAICNNGVCTLTDVTLWTAGVRPNRLVRELPFEKDRYEKIVVNQFHQVPDKPTVYIVGDCASSTFSPSGQLAQHQGEQIANILHDILSGREPKAPGEIKLRGTLGSLGKNDGFGNMFEKSFTGLLPRLAKSGVLWLHKRH